VASTYVNNLRLEEMTTGEKAGTWGNITNTNLQLVGQALGYGTRAIANASTDNITIADGASDADRSMYLKLTGGGQACTVTLLPNTSSKMWIMENATSYTLTFTQGSGANVAIPAGQTKMIFADGLGAGAVVYELGTIAVQNIQADGTVTVGIDDTGYDVTFFGATTGKKLFWDESADTLNVAGTTALDGSLSVTGVTSNADGSAAAPSITNTGDTNTGIFFPAADTVGVAVGGTEVWRYGSNPTTAKNLIINGAMTVAQRGTSQSLGASPVFTCDRWRWAQSSGTNGTMEQTATVPSGVGYANSLRFNPSNAETPGAADFNIIGQRVEAQNLQHLLYGNAAAKTLSLQFYVSSPKTGTHTFAAYQNDKSGGRCYVGTYTVAVADTWEKITTTIAGDTSGQIDNDSGNGFDIVWNIGSGSNYETATINEWQTSSPFLYSTSGAAYVTDDAAKDFYIAGVQLEVGSVATDFEHEDYGTTLAKCLRYFERIKPTVADARFPGGALTSSSSAGQHVLPFLVQKRAVPTVTGTAAATFAWVEGDATEQALTGISYVVTDLTCTTVVCVLSSAATGGGHLKRDGSDTTHIDASAEL
jgi:hypothetical protein